MSIFHYKASLIKQEGKSIFYKFQPDFVSFESIVGEFRINFEDWQTFITVSTKIDGTDYIHCNEKPVSALVYKIQKYFNEFAEFPEDVFWIA